MNLLKALIKFWVVFLVFIAVSCGSDNNEEPVIQNEYLVSSSKVSAFSAGQVALFTSQFGLSDVNDLLVNGFETYKIEYSTEFLGQSIIASGLINIPIGDGVFPIVSLQHGTIAANADAPSVNPTENLLFSAVASAGYIAVVPDFIGFGSSADIVHPYYYEPHIAEPIVDMLRATKEFLVENEIQYDDKLFLGGYSEGGYATMVTHKLIENSFDNEFNLIASAPASGGYDIKHMQEYFFSLETYHNPFYLAFVGLSYETVLGTNIIPLIFQEPYASNIPTLFDGSKSGSEINALLTDNVSDLLTEDFLTNFDTDAKYSEIKTKFIENSPLNWVPKASMYMYHGTSDITVPYSNSEASYDKLIVAGASKDIVQFIPIEGANHSTGALPYFIDVLRKFEALK